MRREVSVNRRWDEKRSKDEGEGTKKSGKSVRNMTKC